MSGIEFGTSSPQVRDLQIHLGTLLGGKVRVTGTYDEATQAAVDEVASRLNLKGGASGRVDAALIKAIAAAAEPRVVVTVMGRTYHVTQKEYAVVMAAAQKKARAIARPWLDLAHKAQVALDAHRRVRDANSIGTALLDQVVQAKFPDEGMVRAATAAAARIEGAMASLTIDAGQVAGMAQPIRDLLDRLDQYATDTTLGGPKLIESFGKIAEGSVLGMKLLGELAAAGKTGPVPVAIAAGVGGYEQLLKEISGVEGASATAGGAIGNIAKAAVVEGMVKLVMKGGAKGVGQVLDDAVKEAARSYSSKALVAYGMKAANGGAQKVIEEAIKAALGEGDLAKAAAKSPEDLKAAVVKAYVDGLSMGALGHLSRVYARGKVWAACRREVEKTAKDFKLNVKDGWEDAVKKVVESVGANVYEDVVGGLTPKEGLDTGKVEKEINAQIARHPEVVAALKKAGAKGAGGT